MMDSVTDRCQDSSAALLTDALIASQADRKQDGQIDSWNYTVDSIVTLLAVLFLLTCYAHCLYESDQDMLVVQNTCQYHLICMIVFILHRNIKCI
jgi:hypothetical protein